MKSCCANIDSQKLFNLVTGILGIYLIYFIAGILHEDLVSGSFRNIETQESQKAQFPLGFVLIPFLCAWLIAAIYNHYFIEEKTQIPRKNSLVCGLAMAFTSVLSIVAMMMTNFPIVVMFESCNVISVVLVAVFCSRVREERLKLGKKKIIIACLVSAGIVMFQFFDPYTQQNTKQSNIIGFGSLIIWIVVEGFFPDLQAEIKSKFKPSPTEMMADINKWGFISLLICMVLSLRLWEFSKFLILHPIFTLEIFIMSIISAFGQFFVYRMIKQFKQHVLPFTVTTRKIFTVLISIILYDHKTHIMQIIGIILVFGTVAIDFITQISKQEKKEGHHQQTDEEIASKNSQKDTIGENESNFKKKLQINTEEESQKSQIIGQN